MRRIRPSPKTVLRLAAHPSWIAEHLRGRRSRRGHSFEFSLADYPQLAYTEQEAVMRVCDASEAEYQAALTKAWTPAELPRDETLWESRIVLLRVLATIVRLRRPASVVEVGVERGYSSVVFLREMAAMSRGHLCSIDLPPVGATPDFTGQAIPVEFRDRWTLTLGPSRKHVAVVAESAAPVDLFLHDGAHSYESQREDLESVWPYLRPGGLIVVDDVFNAAVVDFAMSVNTAPCLIQRWDEHDAVALLRRD